MAIINCCGFFLRKNLALLLSLALGANYPADFYATNHSPNVVKHALTQPQKSAFKKLKHSHNAPKP